jgi:hypothetical protein
MEHVNGDQSNDHRHQIKVYGYYQLTSEFGISGNLSMISGAPKHRLGNYYGTDYSGNDGRLWRQFGHRRPLPLLL